MFKPTSALKYQIKLMFLKLKTLYVIYKPMLKQCLISNKIKISMSEHSFRWVLICKTMSYKHSISNSYNEPMLENYLTSALTTKRC